MTKKEPFYVGLGLVERLKIKSKIDIEPYTIKELIAISLDDIQLQKQHTKGSNIKIKNKMIRNKLQTYKY